MVKPIRPSEVVDAKEVSIPDEVIIAFNKLIVENWKTSYNYAVVQQDDVVAVITEDMKLNDMNSQMIFSKNWLDVEGIYRKAGWDVEFYKPGYNETGNSYFRFSKKKKS